MLLRLLDSSGYEINRYESSIVPKTGEYIRITDKYKIFDSDVLIEKIVYDYNVNVVLIYLDM